MEHTLGELDAFKKRVKSCVLILVLVEHTLGVKASGTFLASFGGLNPCFSGTYSRSAGEEYVNPFSRVLILVLVEHTLGGRTSAQNKLL